MAPLELTPKVIRYECCQVIGNLSSDDPQGVIYDHLSVSMGPFGYDLLLKIAYREREVECHLPHEALNLSLERFSTMYLVPACAHVAPRLPNI